jgi:hypothetical protein
MQSRSSLSRKTQTSKVDVLYHRQIIIQNGSIETLLCMPGSDPTRRFLELWSVIWTFPHACLSPLFYFHRSTHPEQWCPSKGTNRFQLTKTKPFTIWAATDAERKPLFAALSSRSRLLTRKCNTDLIRQVTWAEHGQAHAQQASRNTHLTHRGFRLSHVYGGGALLPYFVAEGQFSETVNRDFWETSRDECDQLNPLSLSPLPTTRPTFSPCILRGKAGPPLETAVDIGWFL